MRKRFWNSTFLLSGITKIYKLENNNNNLKYLYLKNYTYIFHKMKKKIKMSHSRLIDWCLTPTLAVCLAISWREVSHSRAVLKSNRQNTRPIFLIAQCITYTYGYKLFYSSRQLMFMVFNATFNNISVILWRSVLLVEETGVPGENH